MATRDDQDRTRTEVEIEQQKRKTAARSVDGRPADTETKGKRRGEKTVPKRIRREEPR